MQLQKSAEWPVDGKKQGQAATARSNCHCLRGGEHYCYHYTCPLLVRIYTPKLKSKPSEPPHRRLGPKLSTMFWWHLRTTDNPTA